MSNDPKINHVLEMVASMNRARETGRIDSDSRLKPMLDLSMAVDEFLNKYAFEKGLSTKDIMNSLITLAISGLAESIRDEDLETQIHIFASWSNRFRELSFTALQNNLGEKKS